MLLDLDLSKSSEQLYVEIMSYYDARLRLADYSTLPLTELPFTVSSALEKEFSQAGSLREFWHRQYNLLDIRRNYGLSIHQWLKQPVADINSQIRWVPQFLEERAKAEAEANNGKR